MILSHGKTFGTLVISGGVAANKYIKQRFISEIGEKHGIEIITPPLYLCTDNAAMIAAASIVADIS
jgi:N6-L-threonylcarbamoyladenine synthase